MGNWGLSWESWTDRGKILDGAGKEEDKSMQEKYDVEL